MDTLSERKEFLFNLIFEEQGIKYLELFCEYKTQYKDIENLLYEFDDLLNELVNEKKITRIKYVLQKINYREKEFILPYCEKVEILNN